VKFGGKLAAFKIVIQGYLQKLAVKSYFYDLAAGK